jgi:LPS-assembly lipoprotein
MQRKRRAACALALSLAAAATLAGCGFHLRGSRGEAALPFKTIYVGFPETSLLGNELKRYIRATGNTTIVTDQKQAEAVLQLLSEAREKVVLALDSMGRVRQYSLLYKVNFRVVDSKGKELLPATLVTLKRDINFNESQVLASEQEEALLYRDMQSDLVQQIVRRLAAIKPAA